MIWNIISKNIYPNEIETYIAESGFENMKFFYVNYMNCNDLWNDFDLSKHCHEENIFCVVLALFLISYF